MSVTLSQLRTRARQIADKENSQHVSDSELNSYINMAIAELHDLLIGAYSSDYFISTHTFTTTSNVSTYALPSDFYKLRGVDAATTGTEYASLRPFNFNERNRNDSLSSWPSVNPTMRYRLLGNNLVISPTPTGTYNMKLWYIPMATVLSSDGDTLSDLNQYHEYVVYDAAIRILTKEESDITAYVLKKNEITQRIQNMAQNRDADQPESISDIYAENNDYNWDI